MRLSILKVLPSIRIRRVSSTQARWDLVDVADNPTLATTLYVVGSPPSSMSVIFLSDAITLLSFQTEVDLDEKLCSMCASTTVYGKA
ncbi:hypothetical protein U1Q18_004275 [Sarracenia purpurea var. burkii]